MFNRVMDSSIGSAMKQTANFFELNTGINLHNVGSDLTKKSSELLAKVPTISLPTLNQARSVTNSVLSQTFTLGNQAVELINARTGVNLIDVGSKVVEQGSELLTKASEISIPYSEIKQSFEDMTGVNTTKVIETLSDNVASVKESVSNLKWEDIVQNFEKVRTSDIGPTRFIKFLSETANSVGETISNLKLEDITDAASEQFITAKDNFQQFYDMPSVDSGLKIAPWVIGAAVVTTVACCCLKKEKKAS